MSTPSRLTSLREILQYLYDNKQNALRVVDEAEIPSATIDFGGSAQQFWFTILNEAQKHNKVQALVEIAAKEFPAQAQKLRAAIGSTPPSITVNPSESKSVALSDSARRELVNLLLDCAAITDRSSREAVFAELPNPVRNSVRRSDTPRVDVINLVRACENYPNGIEQLVQAVSDIDGEVTSTQNLVSWWQRYKALGPT